MHIEFTAFARTPKAAEQAAGCAAPARRPASSMAAPSSPQPIELDHNALFHALRNEAFHASILSMSLDGKVTKVLLRDVQMHPFKNEILHVDFQRIDENRKIHMKVPLHFENGETSPAVKVSGAIVSHVLTELDISCLPKDLPEFITVDLVDARRRPFGACVGAAAPARRRGRDSAASSTRWSPRPLSRRRMSKRRRKPLPPRPRPPPPRPPRRGAAPAADAKAADAKPVGTRRAATRRNPGKDDKKK